MIYYRLGTFWDRNKIRTDLESWVGLSDEDAREFEWYVRSYCHNLLSDGICNWNPVKVPDIQWKISSIITHNILGIALFMKAVNDVVGYADSGDEHQEVKFNPIDNDNITANLTKQDVVQHHTLKSLAEALVVYPEASKLLADIYGELHQITIPILNADIIASVEKLDLDPYVTDKTVHVATLDVESVLDAFMTVNPAIRLIATTIQEYLSVNLTTSLLSLNYNPFWELTPTTLTIIVDNE